LTFHLLLFALLLIPVQQSLCLPPDLLPQRLGFNDQTREASRLFSLDRIENLMAHFLPRHDVIEEVIFQLEERHLQRQKAMNARCQKKRLKKG
jgi:hypothetical protein